MLGWTINTVAKTVSLTQRRYKQLQEVLANIKPGQHRVNTKHWHKMLAELRSMVLAIPGAQGLFSTLQHAFCAETKKRLKLDRNVHLFLDDFRHLATQLPSRPTRIAELIPRDLSVYSTTNASGTGMGGVAFINTQRGIVPIL